MHTYIAKIIFRIKCEQETIAQFDEQFRIVIARDEAAAFFKAKQLAMQEETEFVNKQNTLIKWQFINIEALFEISDFADGAELFSQTYSTHDAQNHENAIHAATKYILHRISNVALQLQ